jgi:hypothetical protein
MFRLKLPDVFAEISLSAMFSEIIETENLIASLGVSLPQRKGKERKRREN